MRALKLHLGAEIDLRVSLEFYELQRTGLGGELRREIEAMIDRIRLNPELGEVEQHPAIRHRTLRKFPYRIVYTCLGEQIWVIAFAHHSRRPRYWSGRKTGE